MGKNGETQDHGEERKELVQRIAEEYRETAQWTGKAEMDERLKAALLEVPREEFVPPSAGYSAYANIPLSIGFGQTISQPYIVAIMTELLELGPDAVVLEAGTGSGYQAAVLAKIAKQVYSIEFIPELAEQASERLRRLGFANVEVKVGDASAGWPEKAPFDAIIVTAAAAEIPPRLIEQLKPGGHMVIPVGLPFQSQDLMVVTKDAEGHVTERSVLPVAFVPLVHGKGKTGIR